MQESQPRVKELLGTLAIYKETLARQKEGNKFYQVLNYSFFPFLKLENFTVKQNVT
jgi:hypothetical protein